MPKAAVSADGRIHMLDDAGAPVTVDRADVQDALGAGFTLESADSVEKRNVERTYGTLGQQVITGVEGGLQEATLGAGTAGLAAIMGDEYRRGALARRQVNPNAYLAGQVAGAVAPAFASGGESLAARGLATLGAPARGAMGLGNLAERGAAKAATALLGEGRAASIASKAIGTGVGGAVEGSLQSIGSSLADSALENTDWTAERALSAMADGASYGFKTGALTGGASAVLGVAGRRVVDAMTEGKTLKQAITDFGEKRAVKSLIGNNAKHYNDLTNFGTDMTKAKRVGRKILDEGIPVDDIGQSVQALKSKTTEAAERMKAVAKELDDAGVKVDARKVLADVDSQIAELRKVGLGSHDKVARTLEREIAPLRKRLASDAITPKDILEGGEGLTGSIGRKVPDEFSFTEWWKLRQKMDDSLNWAKRGGDPATDNLRKMRGTVDKGLDDAIEAHAKKAAIEGGPDLGVNWRKAKEDYGDYAFLREAAEDQAIRNEKNRFISPSDYGAGAIMAGGFDIGEALTSDDPVDALQGLAMGTAMALGHKYLRERGSGWIAKAADKIAQSETRMNAAAKRLAGIGSPARLVTRALGARERDKNFDDVMNHLQQYQRDPEYQAQAIQKVIAPLAREQPEVAYKMAERYQQDMAYLASKAPAGSSAGAKSFTPLKEPKFYSRQDREKLTKIAETLADPTSAMDDISQGEIDLDVIDALKERRPLVFGDLRQKVMTECAELDDNLPFDRRNFLSMVFDFEGDPSLSPETMAAIQASTPPPAQGPQGGNGGGFNPKEYVASMALPSQKAGI